MRLGFRQALGPFRVRAFAPPPLNGFALVQPVQDCTDAVLDFNWVP